MSNAGDQVLALFVKTRCRAECLLLLTEGVGSLEAEIGLTSTFKRARDEGFEMTMSIWRCTGRPGCPS